MRDYNHIGINNSFTDDCEKMLIISWDRRTITTLLMLSMISNSKLGKRGTRVALTVRVATVKHNAARLYVSCCDHCDHAVTTVTTACHDVDSRAADIILY